MNEWQEFEEKSRNIVLKNEDEKLQNETSSPELIIPGKHSDFLQVENSEKSKLEIPFGHRKSINPFAIQMDHRKSVGLFASRREHRKSILDTHLSIQRNEIASSGSNDFHRASTISGMRPIRRKSSVNMLSRNTEDIVKEKNMALVRWKFVLETVQKMVRATRMFKITTNISDTFEQYSVDGMDDSMTHQLQLINLKEEAMIIAKLRSIIKTPVDSRTEEQIKVLDKVLNRLPGFLKFPKPLRPKLNQIVKLDSVHANRTIIREGHIPQGFYFLISGDCYAFQGQKPANPVKSALYTGDQSITTSLARTNVRYLRQGELFGEFAISNDDEKRTYTVHTQTACEILRIDVVDYCRVIYEIESEKMLTEQFGSSKGPDSLGARIEFLQRIPVFKNADSEVIKGLARTCQRIKFEPGSTILSPKRNLETDMIYFLLNGQCKLFRILSFLRCIKYGTAAGKLVNGKDSNDASGVVPYIPGEPVPDGYIVDKKLVSVGELSPGDFFPGQFILRREILQLKASKISGRKIKILVERMEKLRSRSKERLQKFERNLIEESDGLSINTMKHQRSQGVDYHSESKIYLPDKSDRQSFSYFGNDQFNFTEEELAAGLDFSVCAKQGVECLVVSRVDLLRRIGEENLKLFVENEGPLGVAVEEIQENFLTRKIWCSYKKKVFRQVLEDRSRKITYADL
ncbi:hypothetical protein HK096_006472, partial [Nowakowskiella sp. JEL0078]